MPEHLAQIVGDVTEPPPAFCPFAEDGGFHVRFLCGEPPECDEFLGDAWFPVFAIDGRRGEGH